MRVGLLGDVMLGRNVAEAIRTGTPAARLWSTEVTELCRSLDLLVVNLECCISARGEPTAAIPYKPFFFRAPPSAAAALTAIGVHVASLANNHALDFGQDAAADTVATLAAHGIDALGLGRGAEAARRALVVAVRGTSVGIVAATDHPCQYAARDTAWGTAYAPLRHGSPPWLTETVTRLRERCGLVIVFLHWGPNMTTAPAAWQRALARDLQEAGADLVAGHSAHVFHGIGWGPRGPIVHDLGGALDDYAVDPRLRNDLGLLAIWRPDGRPPLELVALRIDSGHTGLAAGADADWVARRLTEASRRLGTTIQRIGDARFAAEVTDHPAAEPSGSRQASDHLTG